MAADDDDSLLVAFGIIELFADLGGGLGGLGLLAGLEVGTGGGLGGATVLMGGFGGGLGGGAVLLDDFAEDRESFKVGWDFGAAAAVTFAASS